MLATAWPPEQDVAPAGFRQGNVPAGVVLVTGIARQQDSDAGKTVAGQPRAIEPDYAGAVVDAAARSGQAAPTP